MLQKDFFFLYMKCECVSLTKSLGLMTLITNLPSMASLYRSIGGIPNRVSHVLTVGMKLCREIVRMQ